MLAQTNAASAEERLQPVGGEVLWSPAWVERFVRLGAVPGCQYAQNEEAIDGLFRPMLKIAAGLGITSERGLAMMLDRVIARGLGGGLRWVLSAAGPLRTGVQQAHAFATLGCQDARGFQALRPDLPQDGVLGPETYAALVGALREHLRHPSFARGIRLPHRRCRDRHGAPPAPAPARLGRADRRHLPSVVTPETPEVQAARNLAAEAAGKLRLSPAFQRLGAATQTAILRDLGTISARRSILRPLLRQTRSPLR